MGKPGPARRPALELVREGNQGHRSADRLDGGVRLEGRAPDEPAWTEYFPPVRVPARSTLEKRYPLGDVEASLSHIADDLKREGLARKRRAYLISREISVATAARKANQRARDVARAEWRRIVPPLDRVGVLATVDRALLVDHCITWAQVDMCVRDIAEHGIWTHGERGAVKNPAATALNQMRSQLRWTCSELGLTPPSRDQLEGAAGDDDDDPFD